MTLLITGTGSLAHAIIKRFQNNYHKIVAYSRDEYKHGLLPKFVVSEIGDIRDFDRFNSVVDRHKPDVVIHTAAKKVVPLLELYPMECVKTNIIGTDNVARACHENGVKSALFICTDKAVNPAQVYGCSKSIARSIWSEWGTRSQTKFITCLYGNVLMSRGSIVPIWIDAIKNDKPVMLTNYECTRFLFTLDDSVTLIEDSLFYGASGESIIPIMDSFRMIDVIKALEIILGKKADIQISGVRPGEKIHEEMLTEMEFTRTYKIPGTQLLRVVPQIIERVHPTPYQGKMLRSDLFINEDKDALINLLGRALNA